MQQICVIRARRLPACLALQEHSPVQNSTQKMTPGASQDVVAVSSACNVSRMWPRSAHSATCAPSIGIYREITSLFGGKRARTAAEPCRDLGEYVGHQFAEGREIGALFHPGFIHVKCAVDLDLDGVLVA